MRQKKLYNEPIFYEDGSDWRIVDLRPHGVDCIPLFAAVKPSFVDKLFQICQRYIFQNGADGDQPVTPAVLAQHHQPVPDIVLYGEALFRDAFDDDLAPV